MEEKNTYNNLIYLCLILGIFKMAMDVFKNAIMLLEEETIVFQGSTIYLTSHTWNAINIIYGLLLITSIVLILTKMKAGIFLLFAACLSYAGALVLIANGEAIEGIVYAVGYCALMSGLLCLRANGKSAWRVLFSKEKQQKQR